MPRILPIFIVISLAVIAIASAVFAENEVPQPFGGSIFQEEMPTRSAAISDPRRLIGYGDRILVRMWGAMEFERVIMVDGEGQIFIPQVGPVSVANKPLKEAQNSIKDAVSKVYKASVSVHATVADINPISVYVTGNVLHPGRYEGNPSDSALDYLLKAGGINPQSGSYRDVLVRNRGLKKVTIDLYDFILRGQMEPVHFEHGDTIIVQPRRPTILVTEGASNNNAFEFMKATINGSDLSEIAIPAPGISHALVTRRSEIEDRDIYLTLKDFERFVLKDGDAVSFLRDRSSETITVTIDGEYDGQSNFSLKKGASLKALLSFISVDPKFVDMDAIHIERPSVAAEQEEAFRANLMRLQRRALTSSNASGSIATIRSAEAQMIEGFIQSTKDIEFAGKVVLSRNGKVSDITLQDGDRIIIPRKSDVVTVSGDVLMTNTFVYKAGLRVKDYVNMAGGLINNADPERFVLNKVNGEALIVSPDTIIRNGDQIIAMPRIDNKELALAGDLVKIIYQVALGANALINP